MCLLYNSLIIGRLSTIIFSPPSQSFSIQFIAIIPSTLSANFDYGYEASSSDMSCKRELGGGVMASFGYDKPLTLEQSGSRFQTIFVIDQFKPGRCGWKFIGFGAQVVKPGFSSIALTKYDAETSTPEAIHLDVWCASRNNRPMGGCNDLSFLAFDKNIPASFIATLSSAQLQARFPVRFGASTKSTTVEFHDIDDQIGDRPQPRK